MDAERKEDWKAIIAGLSMGAGIVLLIWAYRSYT